MLKKIILCFAAGLTALSLGLGIFYAGEFLVSIFQTSETKTIETVKTEEIAPKEIPVEEIIYPNNYPKIETEEPKAETNEQTDESIAYGFDPSGEYYLIGGADKGFEEMQGLYIKTMEYKDDPDTKQWVQNAVMPEGNIYNEAGKELKFARLFISEKHISFETVSKNEISYRFEGKFVENKEVKYNGETDAAVIEGFLIKLKNGREIVRRIAHYGEVLGC